MAGAALIAACASARGTPADLPPFRYGAPLSGDSARTIVLAALDSARLQVDGAPLPSGRNTFSSTFTVRKGGMGEAEIQLMLRLRAPEANDSTLHALSILEVDATARERNRMLTMSPEEARQPGRTRQTHPINADDRDALGRLGTFLRALERSGFARQGR
ncbi:MAG: hypothetical protein ABIT38_13030 [Gemmatimonadaceae bacterium]